MKSVEGSGRGNSNADVTDMYNPKTRFRPRMGKELSITNRSYFVSSQVCRRVCKLLMGYMNGVFPVVRYEERRVEGAQSGWPGELHVGMGGISPERRSKRWLG